MNYKFIINGNAGNGKVRKHIVSILAKIKRHFSNYDYTITEKLSDLDFLDCENDYDAIVAVGGDGTINGIVNKIVGMEKHFGILPLGSGNDFIHTLKIPRNIDAALETLKNNHAKRIDVGQIITEKYNKFFVNAVGIGFDAMVGYETNQIKFIDGGIKYYLALIHSLFSYKPQELRIDFDGNSFKKKTFLFTVGNGRRTGGAFLLTPGALLDDAFFDLCLVDEVSIPTILKALPLVLKGSHDSVKQVKFYRAKTVNISSENDIFVHYDGETPCMIRSAEIKILPNKISVIC